MKEKMILDNMVIQQQKLKNIDSDSVFLVNNSEISILSLAEDLQKVGYQVNIVENMDNIYKLLSESDLKFSTINLYNLFILINVNQINTKNRNLIGAIKLSYRKNIHFIYYSKEDNILSHLQGIRHYGEAFITTPINSNDLVETIKKISPIEQLEYKILFIDDDESIGIYYKNIFIFD